ncbi:hypothetical protein D3C77_07550 [compost metagenome]|jgi:hypothetical protein|uniref:hypothetical protein n=1 Tax=Pseudomonas TaxID=286 RepID=UPI000CFDEDE1|nr:MULTISPECIES: hypothetical protein [unclassified Pseudomonas]MCW2267841.1 hypothetical protein [Pseudomonas sp. JUb96]PRA71519.1 hypothetical protein CQ065_02385 [Pseudomonas sp. MYb187]
MRIDGFSSQSYPIKRTARKAPARSDDVDEDLPGEYEVQPQASTGQARTGGLPARPQDMIFPRACNKRTAQALTSYLTTAGFVDWEMEVLGLDLYI